MRAEKRDSVISTGPKAGLHRSVRLFAACQFGLVAGAGKMGSALPDRRRGHACIDSHPSQAFTRE